VRAYALDALAEDVLALAPGPLRVVGHDWGGIIGWHLATRHPARVERLVIANAPHPAAWAGVLARRPSQLLKSTYVGFFQLPGIPEALLRAREFAAMKRALETSSRPGTFSPADLARYAEGWAQPGALTAMLNYYRALPLSLAGSRSAPARVAAPTLVLWGALDAALDRENASAAAALCDQAEVRYFEEATHWVHLEEPERVTDALLGFL
jgi:pimeloyl-ACP methyl ester carboxylesterase